MKLQLSRKRNRQQIDKSITLDRRTALTAVMTAADSTSMDKLKQDIINLQTDIILTKKVGKEEGLSNTEKSRCVWKSG